MVKNNIFQVGLVGVLVFFVCSVHGSFSPKPVARKRLVGYMPNWYLYPKKDLATGQIAVEPFEVKDIYARHLTHIIYAFAKPFTQAGLAEGPITSYRADFTDPWADIDPKRKGGNVAQLKKLKEQNPDLKVLISIGGWSLYQRNAKSLSLAEYFSKMAEDPAKRAEFIASVTDTFIGHHGFDGVDIDREYPAYEPNGGRPQDTANFTILIKELREALDKKGRELGKHLLLTVAGPAWFEKIKKIQWSKIHRHLDFINLMTYNFNGAWGPQTHHNAPLYSRNNINVHAIVKKYVTLGVPAQKLNVGLGLYGRSFEGVGTQNNGLYQAYGQAGPGTGEKGMLLYADILKRFASNPDYQEYWDDKAKVPYLFSRGKKVFISYDNKRSLLEKVDYVKKHKLGGAMIWTLGNGVTQQIVNTIGEHMAAK
jgi:chitinase